MTHPRDPDDDAGHRLRQRFDRWQVARVRSAYLGQTGQRRHGGDGLPAMVDEMQRALDEVPPGRRAAADEAVLRAMFFAPIGTSVLKFAFSRWPSGCARVLASLSPWTLRFLVGDIRVDRHDPRINRIERCSFRALGGRRLCQQVCKAPSEAFARKEGFPVQLCPDAEGPGCVWTWGRR